MPAAKQPSSWLKERWSSDGATESASTFGGDDEELTGRSGGRSAGRADSWEEYEVSAAGKSTEGATSPQDSGSTGSSSSLGTIDRGGEGRESSTRGGANEESESGSGFVHGRGESEEEEEEGEEGDGGIEMEAMDGEGDE